MAIIHPCFFNYLCSILRDSSTVINMEKEPLLVLAQSYCIDRKDESYRQAGFHNLFTSELIKEAKTNYESHGIVGVFKAYFGTSIINQFVESEIGRKVLVLKKGYKSLTSTKASIILNGFGYELSTNQVLSIYASYGLTRGLKDWIVRYNFVDINRRVQRLSELVSDGLYGEESGKVHNRFLAIRAYIVAGKKEKERAINQSSIKRSLFFYYLMSFKKYGLLGIVDKGKEVFRASKIGIENEAPIVLDKG